MIREEAMRMRTNPEVPAGRHGYMYNLIVLSLYMM